MRGLTNGVLAARGLCTLKKDRGSNAEYFPDGSDESIRISHKHKSNQTDKTMRTVNQPKSHKFKSCRINRRLAAIVGSGMLALGTAQLVGRAHAGPPPGPEGKILQDVIEMAQSAQVAELDQLAADFHGALSYGGNITNMMRLWADNSSITLNGTAHVGKAAVQAFFQGSGYFLNNWVSLAPEYKTVITVHGNRAEITTQCVAIDLTASPMVVKSVIQVNATCEKTRGTWLFTSMNNTTPAPL